MSGTTGVIAATGWYQPGSVQRASLWVSREAECAIFDEGGFNVYAVFLGEPVSRFVR